MVGSRYLDMRVTYDVKKKCLRTEHSLYGLPIRDLLAQVSAFISNYPSEIVILHLRHFSIDQYYDMTREHHFMIVQLLQEIFDHETFVLRDELRLPLSVLKERKRSILILYGTTGKDGDNVVETLDWIHFQKSVLPGGVGWCNTQTPQDLVSTASAFVDKQHEQSWNMYKVAVANTPDDKLIKRGLLNCIFCCCCRVLCRRRCFRPAGLKDLSDDAGDLMVDMYTDMVRDRKRINIIDMDHVNRQQKRCNLMERIVRLNEPQSRWLESRQQEIGMDTAITVGFTVGGEKDTA